MSDIIDAFKTFQKNISFALDNTTANISYTDNNNISDYALDAVAWTNANGIMLGDEKHQFNPQNNTTRAEAAAVFERMYGLK